MVSVAPFSSTKPMDQRLLWAAGLLVFIFLVGGGSRSDIASLPLIRGVFGIAFVFAAWKFGPQLWRSSRALTFLAAGTALLPALQLLPLPPAIWSALPGREIVVDLFEASQIQLPWMPLSLSPTATINALFATLVPITMILMANGMHRGQHFSLLQLVLILGFASGLIGLLQAIGSSNGSLYFYRITNNGSAVGLFANRNHQAIFLACLFPLLAAHLSLFSGRSDAVRVRKILTLAATIFLVPLVLVTGSRTGVLLLLLALPLSFWIYRAPKIYGRTVELSSASRLSVIIYSAVVTLMVALLVFASFRAPALMRLVEEDAAGDLRWKALPTLLEASGDMFPFGSGLGSFAEVYKIYEPAQLLSPRYLNQAHNDYVEVLLTGGAGGLLLLGFALYLLASHFFRTVRVREIPAAGIDDLTLARAGAAVLLLLAIASVGDYPVRTPSIAAFAAVATAWLFVGLARAVRA